MPEPVSGARASSVRPWAKPAAFVLCTLTLLGLVSPYSLLLLLTRGSVAAAIILAATLAGAACLPARWIRLVSDGGSHRADTGITLLLGAGLGLGGMSLLVLGMGALGVLHRGAWIAVLLMAGVVGARRVLRRRSRRLNGHATAAPSRPLVERFMGWIALPFALIALISAAHAPGFLWKEEAFGYDALEYHLQMPKEYLQQGRIAYAPHNIYANFPETVEMLYLLSMIVQGDAMAGAETANYLHFLLGALTVAAAWLAGRAFSPAAGRISAVLAATTGWLVYFSGLAYVENGLLFFGMLSLACALAAWRRASGTPQSSGTDAPVTDLTHSAEGRASHAASLTSTESGKQESPEHARDSKHLPLLAGAFAGFACGCKYTAVAMILVPLAGCTFIMASGSLGRRLRSSAVLALAALATFSPWLIKNALLTGNPVFPLASSAFHAYPPGWSADSQRRWDEGHAPPPREQTLAGRIGMLKERVFGDPDQRLAPAPWLLAATALAVAARSRTRRALAAMLVMQLAVWLLATHLYARFSVVFMVPLIPLAASAMGSARAERRWIVHAAVVAGAAYSAAFVIRMALREFWSVTQPGMARWIAEGELPGFEFMRSLRELPAGSRVLMIGEARAFYCPPNVDYAVVFNEQPLGEIVRAHANPRDVVSQLRARGWSHVLVNYMEMDRLRSSRYGFDPDVTARLFTELESAGLFRVETFNLEGDPRPYVVLYRVPQETVGPAPPGLEPKPESR
ncbi:MAG: hypothetical protein IT449_17575 [Phycisphaerales bacterium]|nr:hypothetical protein [Phycisphaerales bacterium]